MIDSGELDTSIVENGEMITGETWNEGAVSFDPNNKNGKPSFGDSGKPQAILLYASMIVDSIRRAEESGGRTPNRFVNVLKNYEQAQDWYNNLEAEVLRIMNENVLEPTSEGDFEQILEQNPEIPGEYKNVYTPVLKDSRRFPKYQQFGVDKFGKLEQQADRDIVEEIFETDFESVSPSQLSIQIPQVMAKMPQVPTNPSSLQSKTAIPTIPSIPIPTELQQEIESIQGQYKEAKDRLERIAKTSRNTTHKLLAKLIIKSEAIDWTKVLFVKYKEPAGGFAKDGYITYPAIPTNEIFLHELLHGITQNNLVQGYEDFKNNIPTKESKFYQELSIILQDFKDRVPE